MTTGRATKATSIARPGRSPPASTATGSRIDGPKINGLLDRVALGRRAGDAGRLLVDAALDHEVGPRVEDRHLVAARVDRAPLDELRAVPVELEVALVVEGRGLQELVHVVAVTVDEVARRPVAHGDRRDLGQRGLELVA